MKLITKEIERALKKFPLDSQDGKEGICVCKFFNPCGRETWYVTEGDFDGEDWTFFGYVTGLYEDEWGYFTLSELRSVKGPFGLGIERDMYYKPCSKSVSELLEEERKI